MSITISNCEQIRKSPVNNSRAKMLWTFSKSARFPKRKVILCDKFYDKKSSVSPARTTTFGYGQKYEFSKDIPDTPPCNNYNIPSDFTNTGKKGFGFGQGRTQMEVTGPLVETIRNKNPGPGAYKLNSTLNKSAYTLGARIWKQDKQKNQFLVQAHVQTLIIPDPVTFSLNSTGTYFLAKYKNSLVRNFSQLSCRQLKIQNKAPGPGAYDVSKQQFSPDGRYISSKMPSAFSRRFGSSSRGNLDLKSITPGPGNYKLPSEFGHYLAKNVYQSRQNSKDHQNGNDNRKSQVQQSKENKQNKQNKGN